MSGAEQLMREELLDEEWKDLMQSARNLGVTAQEVRVFLAEATLGLVVNKGSESK